MKQTFTKLLCALCLLSAGMATAQTPFWSENFTDGIPTGWTNVDASGHNVLWTWCSDPTAGNSEAGCAPVFDDALNLQTPFAATTAATGFVTVDSDEAGQLSSVHKTELTTTAINCTGKSVVFASFESHTGVYQPNDQTMLLRVSTDKVNWTTYNPFPDLTIALRWSDNPTLSVFDISSVAANQATVYLQWQYIGLYEYFWDLDDVKLYPENPTARFNLTISDFFYPASSFATPESQIATDTFGFFAYVNNEGLNAMTNVVLTAKVKDQNDNVLFADSTTVDEIPAGTVDTAIVLPNVFAPELPIGVYSVSYELHADSIDARPEGNSGESPFLVTANVFSKENQVQLTTRPANDVAWNVGNYYKMGTSTLEDYKASIAQFTYSTDPAELAITDVEATIYLFKVNDGVDASFSNFESTNFPSDSVTWIGYASYEAPDTMENFLLQDVQLLDFNTSEPGVLLEPGGRYFLMIGYPDNVRQTQHGFNRDIRYVNQVSTVLYTDQWFLAGFGPDYNAVMRMALDLVVTTDEKPLPPTAFNVVPNPVGETLNLAVQFDQPTDATITIADLTGRVIRYEDRQGLTNELVSYHLPQLANGAYLARIATAQGTSTKKFIVQK